ncbi:MAG TPA: hypothetical protein VM033_00045 [Gemmatimonadaceae bacterium]|nr:hypothetical protein [Gemmatimonadaceae bacterium]
MRRRVMLCLTLTMLSACNGDKIGQPIATPTSNTKLISDAVHTVGNPDFFFLPPMVPNPSGGANWDAGAFNASLAPTVEICATTAAGAACPSSPAPLSYPATLRASDEHYAYNWKVPADAQVYYRITVKVGSKSLGFADVRTGTAAEVKNVATGEVIPLVDGRTLPIKFRIERYALCDTPGAATCTSASADISTTSVTLSTGTPTADPSGISTASGVTIPAQGGTEPIPVTVTLASCADISQVIGRRTVGECVRVTTDPVLSGPLVNRATVFICSVGVGAYGLTAAEAEAVTMYRSDQAGVAALAHTDACKPGTPGGVVASANSTLGGMLASLARGEFRRAASQAVELISPKPLYAAMFIDLGGGGLTESFSDFQFALPLSVLIYGPSLFSPTETGRPNNEATLAQAAGITVTVWDAATWETKTSADFARFNAIVFADLFVSGNCATSTTHLAAAETNKAVWSSVVTGPAVILGTDPVFHQINKPEAPALMTNALKFAVSDPAATGLYASLSCYYHAASDVTPTAVDFLSAIGGFQVLGQTGLGQTATIVNTSHPVMAGLTNAGLSDWNESAHEAFPILNSYPSGFQVLTTINKPTTSENLPYIIARGSISP